MYKFSVIFLAVLLSCVGLYAQHTETFNLIYPELPFSNGLYNKLQVLDSRTDTTQLGIVQTGAFNRKAKVITNKPLGPNLVRMFGLLSQFTTVKGTMLLQLRQFSFAEITASMSEKGYCYLRAGLYSQKAGQYQKIKFIDTVIYLSSIDVTQPLLRKGSEALTDFITHGMLSRPIDSTLYSYQDLVNIDELEKQKLKLYTATNYTDGLYLTYRSFASQVPDKPVTVKGMVSNMGNVTTINDKGKPQRVKPQKVYAIVYNGQPYVTSRDDFYPVTKTGNDFIFTGKAAVAANTGEVVMASVFFGMLGGLMASGGAESTFEMKIDHVNGGFIRLLEIPNTTPASSYDYTY
ncbi:hypothetical protein ACFQ3S_18800 [Mucilaginibacter terrae]|uniref:hypothetical protein n=1 Tax=Mucilaginibacter terrae TaxID=1955052 RepID=UPI0036433B4D